MDKRKKVQKDKQQSTKEEFVVLSVLPLYTDSD
jgi:hypothetical protein